MLDWNLILQAVITALLLGAGGLLYRVSIAVATIQTELHAHTQQDATQFAALQEGLTEVGKRRRRK